MSQVLAIDGGAPVRSRLLPYGRQTIDDGDIAAVVAALRSDHLTTGPRVDEFEAAVAAATGARYAVAVSNGTAALHAAVFAAGLGPGDEAITTPLTFAATSNAVLYQGATPVFVDVDPQTLLIDPERIKAAITPRTRAILPVDYTGVPADLDAINEIARAHGLVVIEDAAHALGATYHGRPVGSLASMTTFSLHPVKHVTTGEGGVITTDDDRFASRLKAFRNHGITIDSRQREKTGSWTYEIAELGFNYRLTDVQSALGTSQLQKLAGWVARRRAIAAAYTERLSGHPAIQLPVVPPGVEPAWHLFVILLRLERLSVDRAQVFRALRAENIGVNVHYIPVPWHPLYANAGYERGRWPAAEAAYERLLTLPLWPQMSDDDVDDVVEAVEKVLAHYAVPAVCEG
ncbi:MAG TPA: UDP-4-amino-4,6-dideoxy-N-acetyl-beta-L-altrosamine transaminase [Vicinamibacterales bacterium]|nr:UDP-4-amino-4,6-dideoxy-N-acetyl-beta-L-altrosamine transaminase [Vicinamibacterales bacterium]